MNVAKAEKIIEMAYG